MTDHQARGVERAIAEAEARGEFKNLPGVGKPLPGIGQPLHDDWWLRQKATRENIGLDTLPPALRLARELDDLEPTLDDLDTEAAVRAHIDTLNTRIRKALIAPTDGPPLRFGPLDPDTAVQAWNTRRRTAT